MANSALYIIYCLGQYKYSPELIHFQKKIREYCRLFIEETENLSSNSTHPTINSIQVTSLNDLFHIFFFLQMVDILGLGLVILMSIHPDILVPPQSVTGKPGSGPQFDGIHVDDLDKEFLATYGNDKVPLTRGMESLLLETQE
jgi:hypothetical protein